MDNMDTNKDKETIKFNIDKVKNEIKKILTYNCDMSTYQRELIKLKELIATSTDKTQEINIKKNIYMQLIRKLIEEYTKNNPETTLDKLIARLEQKEISSDVNDIKNILNDISNNNNNKKQTTWYQIITRTAPQQPTVDVSQITKVVKEFDELQKAQKEHDESKKQSIDPKDEHGIRKALLDEITTYEAQINFMTPSSKSTAMKAMKQYLKNEITMTQMNDQIKNSAGCFSNAESSYFRKSRVKMMRDCIDKLHIEFKYGEGKIDDTNHQATLKQSITDLKKKESDSLTSVTTTPTHGPK